MADIAEVAELWAPQLKIPKDVVQRELQYGFYKIQRSKSGNSMSFDELKEPLKQPLPESELPSKDSLINREFIDRFCDKQFWMLPAFWDKGLPTGPSFPGRPSIMAAIVQELKERATQRRGVVAPLAQQARELHEWAKTKFPANQVPTTRSIENGVRLAYTVLKGDLGDKPRPARSPTSTTT